MERTGTALASARLARLPVFDPGGYLALNADIAAAGLDALSHAVSSGLPEGRRLFGDLALARAYGLADARPGPTGGPPRRAGDRCSVFVHRGAEAGDRETAAQLRDALADAGLEASLRHEGADPRGDHGTAIFVAPHDFFRVGLGQLWSDAEILADALVYVDAPLGSAETRLGLQAVLLAGGAIDTSAVNVSVWRAAGIPAHHHEPRIPPRDRWITEADAADPLMRAAPRAARAPRRDPLAWCERPIDVLFFDRDAPSRVAWLARSAARLAEHRCYIYARSGERGSAEDRLRRDAHWRIAGHLGACSRLTLHLGEDRLPALDRRRVIDQTMACGSIVVSDAAFAGTDLRPGVHYFQETPNRLAGLAEWLLSDADGRRAAERVRAEAFAWIAAQNRPSGRTAALAAFVRGAAPSDLP